MFFFIIYRRTQSPFLSYSPVYSSVQAYYEIPYSAWVRNVTAFVLRIRSNIIHPLARDAEITGSAKSRFHGKIFRYRYPIFFKVCARVRYAVCQYSTLMHDVRDRRAKAESGWPTCKSLLPHDRDYFFFRHLVPLEDHKIISRSCIAYRPSLVKKQSAARKKS